MWEQEKTLYRPFHEQQANMGYKAIVSDEPTMQQARKEIKTIGDARKIQQEYLKEKHDKRQC